MFFLNKYFGGKTIGKQKLYLIAITIIWTIFCKGFSFSYWNNNLNYIEFIFVLFVLFYTFATWGKASQKHFKSIVILFSILPFFSAINSYIYFEQSPFESIRAIFKVTFIPLTYFVLHKLKLQEATILKSFFLTTLFILILQVVQQFTYPTFYFGGYTEAQIELLNLDSKSVEMRNGLYRFRIEGLLSPLFLFIFWIWVTKKYETTILIFAGLMLLSVYLTLTRQVILSAIITILLSFLLHKRLKNTSKFNIIILLLVVVCILAIYFDDLFGSFVETSQSDMSENYIRILAAQYYWNDYIKSPLVMLFGYGAPGQTGLFHNYVEKLNDYRFFVADIGFLGYAWRFGAIYVIVCVYAFFMIFFKYKKSCPLYIRLYVCYAMIMSPMIFPFFGAVNMLYISFLFYICDLHINNSPLALYSTRIDS